MLGVTNLSPYSSTNAYPFQCNKQRMKMQFALAYVAFPMGTRTGVHMPSKTHVTSDVIGVFPPPKLMRCLYSINLESENPIPASITGTGLGLLGERSSRMPYSSKILYVHHVIV